MLSRKKKRKLRKVFVTGKSSSDDRSFVRYIDIPEGGSFETTWTGRPKVRDQDGNILREFDWQAGFTIEYEYIYKDGLDCFEETVSTRKMATEVSDKTVRDV